MTSQDESSQTYEPPTLTTLGTFAELTQIVKSGSEPDTGGMSQPSNF